ncbi:phage antirepressor KilAC domain-containing protein [Nocardioides sp. TRM66260-LWL]|uniref:BRO family protein n=1 Tax=Nocardioides sp. TRM66260-LWL TaxID=2874478 RepID=UPI001CC57575|nr:BRO family protein [Nocardioides sp. TRM66260-LWL]MBZ5735028.1 phage antirepressor KilAC domain-containing protein [Nocardioides sp. TRM66260-LWL]
MSAGGGALDLFRYEDHEVHVVVIDGEPWFVAGDVARILGFRMASDLTRMLDDDEKGPHIVRTPGGEQTVTVISEAGLYSAIIRSRVPEAKAFKRWVTHDVLPAIRKTGTYNAPAAISFEEMTAQVIRGLQERIDAAQAAARALEAPAAAWNGLAAADGDFTVSDAAKILARDGIATGPRKLFDWMNDNGWIFRRAQRWQAMQTAVNAGLLVERVTAGYYDERTGERKQADPQVRVTARGLERLRDRLSEQALTVIDGGAA